MMAKDMAGVPPLDRASSVPSVTKYGMMAKKSMTFINSLKKDILLGEEAKRISSSKENQQMHMVSTMKKGSWNGEKWGTGAVLFAEEWCEWNDAC